MPTSSNLILLSHFHIDYNLGPTKLRTTLHQKTAVSLCVISVSI